MPFTHTHYGVYGLVLHHSKKEVLLVQKTKGPYRGMLDLPGGTPEYNETIEETLHREIKEELGATIKKSEKIGPFEIAYEYISEEGVQSKLIHSGYILSAELYENVAFLINSSDTSGSIWVPFSNTAEHSAFSPIVSKALELNRKI